MVHDNSESSLVVEVKSKQHLDKSLMEFKDKVLGKLNDAFSIMGWYLKVSREIMCSQGR